ncbi:MAG TPA: DMT family protein [Cytophagaceae bacterium]|nr:DMT family protein [Cytophagaceae bacterium]
MPQGLLSICLLILSNIFMTLAWYGHLQFKKISWLSGLGLIGVILVSWGLAFFEYIFQVPANRVGHESNGGPFNLFQLKMIQEIISLSVFTVFAVYVFKTDKLQWNYLVGFVFLLLAVFFVFKKW